MIQHLVKYFSLHGHLVLPGIGSLVAETQPAKIEFVEKTLHAPQYTITLLNDTRSDDALITFIASEMKIASADAAKKFKSFIHQLIGTIQAGRNYTIPGLGVLYGNGLGYHFNTEATLQIMYGSINANKIIRQNVSHNVLVGEDNRTSTEMHQLLQTESASQKWWIGAVVLGAIGVAAILYYYLTR